MRTTRKARKRLARKKSNHTGRYIMVALMSTGGGHVACSDLALAQETTISDDTYQGDTVYGNNDGSTYTAYTDVAVNNTITITQDGIVDEVFGGLSTISQDASGNSVIVNGTVIANVTGGQTTGGNADLNSVNIAGVAGGQVWGGLSTTGSANHNTITITGYATGEVYGGRTTSGDAEENVITLDGDVIETSIAGYTESGSSRNNTYILNSGSASYVASGRSDSGIAEDNITEVNDGDLIMAVGADTTTGVAKNNTLTIRGGNVLLGAYGGLVQNTGNGSAENNTVNIYGGTISTVAGGTSLYGNVTDNVVNLYSVSDITDSIQGGKTDTGISSGNTVNLLGTIGVTGTVDGDTIQSFNVYSQDNSVGAITGSIDNMYFYLPDGVSAGDTMLTITGAASLIGTNIDWSASTQLNMEVGQQITLIHGENGLTTDVATTLPGTKSYTYTTGISSDTTYTFSTNYSGANDIVITLDSKSSTLQERTKSLTETSTAMTTLINGGSDFLAAHGMEEAEAVAIDPEISVVYGRLVPFVALGGGSLEIDSGSSTDLKAFYANLGLTKEIKNRNGSLFVGPILEYGRGNYDSYLDSGVHGWGTGHYVGAGGFARQRNHDGLYYEGDLRFGRFSSDYRGDLASGLTADYDLGGSYIAGHLGLGKIYKVNPTDTVDAYIKYFYSRTSGDEVTVHSNLNNEVYNFNSVDSHRLRLGARYYHATNARSKIYAGLAYQYEFNGEAKATHDGLCTPAPSLKGSSYMAEIGWQVKPDKTNMTADVGLTGWAGQQKGIMGRLKLSWAF